MLTLLRNSSVALLILMAGCSTDPIRKEVIRSDSVPQNSQRAPEKAQQVIPQKTEKNALSTPPKKLEIKPSLGVAVVEHRTKSGVMILKFDAVKGKSPAEYSGMKRGDLIVWLDSCEVKDIKTYLSCLDNFKPFQIVQISFERNGIPQKILVELQEKY